MLARESLDGLLAITPLALTATMAQRLLPLGIPLLIEKPPGRTSDDTQAMLAVAQRHATAHMVSFNRRYNPAVMRAKAWLQQYASDRPPVSLSASMLRANRLESDFVVGTGVHLIDTVLSLMGNPIEVTATALCRSNDRCKTFQALLRFGEGRSGTITIAPDAGVVAEVYEVTGPDYRVVVDTQQACLRVWQSGEVTTTWESDVQMSAVQAGTFEEMVAFIDMIENGRTDQPDLRDGLNAMRVAQAVAQGGKMLIHA